MKHILFLTWKDIKHPKRGWAEVVILEYAKRLAAEGNKVTWFASWFKWGSEEEIIDEIHIIRKYSINTIYFFAWNWYGKFKKKNSVDIIIDEAGWIPLLSPLYEKKKPIFFFIHHIGEHEYETAFPFPINKIFKKFVYWTFSLYKNRPTITVSNSTQSELIEKFCFTDTKVIENATHMLPIKNLKSVEKKKEILFLGRLTEMKRPEDAIRAFHVLYQKHPEYILNIVGNKQDIAHVEKLKTIIKDLKLEKNVLFRWYSPEIAQKFLESSEMMLVTSTKEWFWLIVLEGNCYWIPVVAYDVAWLRDSVHNWRNGFLVEDGNYKLMWEKLCNLVEKKNYLTEISESSLEFIKDSWGWNERYKEFKKVILK